MLHIAAGVVLGIVAAAAPAMAQDHWYMARLDAETCVPIEKLGNGILHTPADFVAANHAFGYTLREDPRSNERHVGWFATSPSGKQYYFMMFSDRDFCRRVMATVGAAEEPSS